MKKLSKHFNNLFMILLLPPIIFESGYNLHKKPFFKNIGTVMMYSFLGTFIAIFSTSFMLWIVGSPLFTLKESFAFGSLISATDPVSVLAVFKEMDFFYSGFSIDFYSSCFSSAGTETDFLGEIFRTFLAEATFGLIVSFFFSGAAFSSVSALSE